MPVVGVSFSLNFLLGVVDWLIGRSVGRLVGWLARRSVQMFLVLSFLRAESSFC